MGGTGRDGPRSRVYVPETRAYHSYNKRREQTALDPRYLRRSPPCSLHFGLHTSFAHSTAYTQLTRDTALHTATQRACRTPSKPDLVRQPPPPGNLFSLSPPHPPPFTRRAHPVAPPARAAHTLLGAALGARRLRMARCAYTMCARRRTLGLVLGGGRPAARRAARGLGLGDGAEEQPAGRGGARDASIGAELAWLGYGWGWGWG